MPIYEYKCERCGWAGERTMPVVDRDHAACMECGHLLIRQLSAPSFKFAGRPVQGGGPDRFTADALGIPLKDLPEGLRTKGRKV